MQLFKIVIFFVFVIASNYLYAQVSIRGTVNDSLGKPMQSVSVILKKVNGTLLAFDITNNFGVYKIEYNGIFQKDSLIIEANAIGFKKESLFVKTAVQVSDFMLTATIESLPNIIVQNNKQMLKKDGDTLNYDVTSFSNKQDRTIGDVIKKLPGIEVKENGEISYGGKPINRFYIDGDNLLDGKYNVATNGIPNDMVAKVQILENHQPINVLKDVAISESAAMNIVLKTGARLKVVGTGDLAIGIPIIFNGTINTLLFKKRVKFINYIKINNTGNDLLYETINHFDFEKQELPNLVTASIGGTPELSKKRWLFNNAALINANDLVTLKKDLQLRINCYYLYDRQYQTSQYGSVFFLPNNTVSYEEKNNSKLVNNTFNTQLTLTANRKDYFLNNVTTVDNTPSTIKAHLVATANNNINQQFSGTITNVSNKFNIIKKLDKGNVWEMYSYINRINNPATLEIQPGLYEAWFNNNIPYARLIQHAAIPTIYTNNYTAFSIVTPKFQQNYKLGFNYQNQELSSSLESQQLNGSKALVADSFQNHLTWRRLKLYTQVDFTYINGPITLRAFIPVIYQDTKYKGRLAQNHLINIPISPRFTIRYNTSSESFISINYGYTNGWANIDQVYDGYVMKNYRSFFSNGNILNESQAHSVGMAYISKNTLKMFFFTLGVGYSKNRNSTINDAQLSPLAQQSKLIPFQNISSSLQLYGTTSKYFFPLRTTISAKIYWNRSLGNQLQNANLLRVQNNNYEGNINVYTKFGSFLNMIYNGSFMLYEGKPLNSKEPNPVLSRVGRWQNEINANFNFTNNFFLRVGGENSRYRLQGLGYRSFTFIDASCTFKIYKAKTDVEMSLTNLTGIDTYGTAILTSNSIVESSYLIRPRMVMVKFYFRF